MIATNVLLDYLMEREPFFEEAKNVILSCTEGNTKGGIAAHSIFYLYKENGEFRSISHVAIYVGDGKMAHAANEDRGVVLNPLRTTYVVFYAGPY